MEAIGSTMLAGSSGTRALVPAPVVPGGGVLLPAPKGLLLIWLEVIWLEVVLPVLWPASEFLHIRLQLPYILVLLASSATSLENSRRSLTYSW